MSADKTPSLEAVLAAKTRQLDRLNAHFGNSLWDWELGATTEWYSTRLVNLLDYSLDADTGGNFPNELMRLLSQTKPSTELAAKRIRRQLSQSADFDERLNIVDSEGNSVWLRIRGAVSNNPGEGPYSAGAIEDITDVVVLETERQRFSKELERSNAELESFANVASHDLKAPLRHIRALADELGKPVEGSDTSSLSPLQQRHLSQIKERIGLMDALVTGLLDYAVIGRPQDRSEPTDLGQLARDTLTLLKPPGHFRIELAGSAPSINVDVVLLQKCVRNLLDNAIKHADAQAPHVKVVIADHPQGVSLAVHDNGGGIPKSQRSRVFDLFQTLEQSENTKGSGMGLAVVKKSIKTLGGSVSISTSELGGACVEISCPRPKG